MSILVGLLAFLAGWAISFASFASEAGQAAQLLEGVGLTLLIVTTILALYDALGGPL